jgi:acetyl-CoA carboxylase biotin carboxyl carrier protein
VTVELEFVRELAKIAAERDLTRLEVREGDFELVIERNSATVTPAALSAVPSAVPVSEQADSVVTYSDLYEVKSPLVGVFYAAPAPGAEPYATIGGHVKRGDVLCLVETMKLMNEITAERDGEIADICVRDGDVAEYGQTLFKMVVD